MPNTSGIRIGVCVILGGVVGGVVCFGPFFGALLGAGLALLPALAAEFVWRDALRAGRLARVRMRRILLILAVIVPAVAVYLPFKPPSGPSIVEKYLGLSRNDIDDVQTWTDTWGIDPMYVVKFRTDTGELERALAFTGLTPASEPVDRVSAIWHPRRDLPTWWTPEQIADAQAWSRGTEQLRVQLRFNPQTREAYLLVMYF